MDYIQTTGLCRKSWAVWQDCCHSSSDTEILASGAGEETKFGVFTPQCTEGDLQYQMYLWKGSARRVSTIRLERKTAGVVLVAEIRAFSEFGLTSITES